MFTISIAHCALRIVHCLSPLLGRIFMEICHTHIFFVPLRGDCGVVVSLLVKRAAMWCEVLWRMGLRMGMDGACGGLGVEN